MRDLEGNGRAAPPAASVGDPGAEWCAYWRAAADPLVIDRAGRSWAYADWDFEGHGPRHGRTPRHAGR